MGLTVQPASPAGGIIYGPYTEYNSSGTYTIPSTASQNSTIMVETWGGGGGGGNPEIYRLTNVQAYFGTNYNIGQAGGAGNYFLGVFRLGLLATSPAGQTMTVTVGAGGSGSSMNANGTHPSGSAGTAPTFPNANSSTAGGASQLVFSGTTFAIANGGAAASASGTSRTTSSVFVDSTLTNALGPYSGTPGSISGGISTNTFNVNASNSNNTSKLEWGNVTVAGAAVAPNTQTLQINTTTTLQTATDATAGTGGCGGLKNYSFIATSGVTITNGRAGNGAAPGGAGGGWPGYTINSGFNAILNAGQTTGNGGAGRVRIWYQA